MSAITSAVLAADPRSSWSFVARSSMNRLGHHCALGVAADPRVTDLLAATDLVSPERRSTEGYDPKAAIWKVRVWPTSVSTARTLGWPSLAERLFRVTGSLAARFAMAASTTQYL